MKKILLVDDNEQDRMLYKRYLTKQTGYESVEIHESSSGEDAIRQYRTLRPDCVLLDYNLPDTTGLEVLVGIKQFFPAETMCIIMITGGGSETLAVRALNEGALDYLVKQQFDQELLLKTVKHAIEKNEWRQYEARYHAELQGVNQQLRDSLAELTEIRRELAEKNEQLTTAHHQEKSHNQELDTINQRLARTNADLDNFVYAASHDLRQPIHNLRGLFEELRRTATFHDPEEAHLLQLVDESLQSLSSTITDLAHVVQVEQLPGEQPPEMVDIAEMVADIVQTLLPQIVAAEATVQTNFTALPAVEYVRSNLRTILLNLLTNSIKYRDPNRAPLIEVRSLLVQGQPVLEVQDNGLGLNLERYGAELFQLFRRFHPQAGEGTGVGLFLVNRLVHGEGGRIEVESQDGAGTTFRLYLRAPGGQ
ncbi:hybrid sensor histidine kinase/response regulator [Hymenobacter sp. BT18]|uniref:ATP-binding response regulator n=1 Tax=Hymenobacter sp. BT18 TaxID=2835648 RepID=UPI00143E6328|nr:hybrid sensor histidine kinase/response regulator [Hymenobacter sp. BT18]QIX60813.1 hybrid sensor histidine kinase/response regulator [Hymenobacter sp. BT18]